MSHDDLVLDIQSLAQAGELQPAAVAAADLLQVPLPLSAEHERNIDIVAAELIDACLMPDAPAASEEVIAFFEGAIRCTATAPGSAFSADPVGKPNLHKSLAMLYALSGSYVKSQRHMLRADAPAQFAHMLATWAGLVAPGEAELLLCRAALGMLCVTSSLLPSGGGSDGSGGSGGSGSGSDATSGVASVRALLREASVLHRSGTSSIDPDSPLGHFVELLLIAVEKRAPPMIGWLVEQYGAWLKRDPALLKYATVIQQRTAELVQSAMMPAAGEASELAGGASTIEEND